MMLTMSDVPHLAFVISLLRAERDGAIGDDYRERCETTLAFAHRLMDGIGRCQSDAKEAK